MAIRWVKLAGEGALSALWVLKRSNSRVDEAEEIVGTALDASAK